MARTGRRPGTTQTREQILEAAREQFAESGYSGATVRGIARSAGVDPALVHHFFGSKDQVFIEAMRLPYNPAAIVRRIIAGTDGDRAVSIVRYVLDVWDRPETQTPMLALLRSAANNDHAAMTVRGFMSDILQHHIAVEFAIDPVRASAAGSQILGLILTRYLFRIEPIASADAEEVARVYAPAIRAVIQPEETGESE
ncbi:MAG: TetR family transcriptional regulator [Nocardiopsaceae bacterium]|nr:TetR family transcriptional regulator [Nocardiopsaceae bacterium]